MRQKAKRFSIDMIFVLTLFCVFATTALLLVFAGTRVYEDMAGNLQSTFSSRTAVSYLKKQSDHHAVQGAISIGAVEGTTALQLAETVNEVDFVRYIYLHEGYLRELYTKADIPPQLSAGQTIVRLQDFTMTADGALIHFTVQDEGDNRLHFSIATL